MSEQSSTLQVSVTGARADIVLTRPHRLNAFTLQAIRNLSATVDELVENDDVRIVTLRGEGRAFSTGVDLKELPSDGFGAERLQAWEQMLRRIETMEKLVICLIHGYAVGGGLQLALACDIRVATTTARVGLPASKEGIIPGLATYRLARYVGLGRAKQLIYLGNLIGSAEAERIGLVDHLVADSKGDDNDVQEPFDTLQFETLVEQYTASFSAGGRNAKALLADCFNQDFAEFLDFYERQQAKAVASPDFVEAQAAYREKRDANWN